MRYLRLHTLGFAALLVALTVIHCLPTEVKADRRRRWTTYGSDRGRLVVACDMRSATCSDGRRITTERATPVPCETSPGVWEMVPADTGCYSVRGLESWEANTSYLSYGAQLDRSPWGVSGQTTREKHDGFYRITGTASDSRIFQFIVSPEEGVWTVSCIMRTSGNPNPRLRIHQQGASGGGVCSLGSSDEFSTYSCTQTITGNPTQLLILVYSDIGHIDVQGCWLTKSATPGRACWGGEAPVTCARDYHRMPATGFPTTTGEISWVMSLERVPDGGEALRGIVWADGAAVPDRISLTGGGGIRVYTGETAYITGPLSWEPGRSYTFRLIMAEDEWKVVRDGALVGSTPPLGSMDWGATVRLGDLLDGSIRSLTVRSYEEVSP